MLFDQQQAALAIATEGIYGVEQAIYLRPAMVGSPS
jgi:hypothetical protein